jgi:excisionase family DNA binding protein
MISPLSVKEAASRLGVSPALVYALCARKMLRHERHGLGRGKIVIPEDALDEYRRRRTVGADDVTPTEPGVPFKHLRV